MRILVMFLLIVIFAPVVFLAFVCGLARGAFEWGLDLVNQLGAWLDGVDLE